MARTTNQVIIWRLRRAARDLDWPALGGIVLAMLAVGLYLATVRPLESQNRSLRDRVAELKSRADSPPRDAEPALPESQLAAFYGQLTTAQQASELVRRLHSHATSAGLALERGEYRPLPDASGKLMRYQIVLPVKGTYPQVRRFLSGAMREVPGLALDGIAFQRETGSSAAVEAQLRFTVFLRMSS